MLDILAPILENPLAAFLFATGFILIVIAAWGMLTGQGNGE